MRKVTEVAINEYKELIKAGYTEGTALELIKIAEIKRIVGESVEIGIQLDAIGNRLDRIEKFINTHMV